MNVMFFINKCYNGAMEIPWRCGGCGRESMVDLDNLLTWPVDKVISAEGFRCAFCEAIVVVGYMTTSLKDNMCKLLRYPPEHKKFLFKFKKALKKAEGVNERGDKIWRARK